MDDGLTEERPMNEVIEIQYGLVGTGCRDRSGGLCRGRRGYSGKQYRRIGNIVFNELSVWLRAAATAPFIILWLSASGFLSVQKALFYTSHCS